MKNLQGLVSFVESAAAGSFTAAAARLALTPAAVSKNVIALERQLQVRLFNRSTRRLKLTGEGEAFLANASEALRLLDDAVNQVTRASGEPAGRVRISSGISFGRRYVLPLLPRLAARHALLQVELSLDNRAVDLVAEGYDIGVRGGMIPDSSLVARRVAQLPVALVASSAYLRQHGAPATPAELPQHRLLGVRFASGQIATWHFRKSFGRVTREWEPTARIWASDPESLVDLALAGHGITQTGLHHVVPWLRSGRLKVLLAAQHEPGQREIVLHYPHRQFLSARVRVVVDALLEHFKQQQELLVDPRELPAEWLA
ncbi:LysR family transcriptional regulator [Pseudaquabacterium terrae]|uniref:LysR family transcriptional regulator n=1 Tax=Pseudaquabacterium terrae TaxID=2732868 RepID=UPI001C26D3A5|nr:LysR family transcriptional regulator [Aquabacterium terrae]